MPWLVMALRPILHRHDGRAAVGGRNALVSAEGMGTEGCGLGGAAGPCGREQPEAEGGCDEKAAHDILLLNDPGRRMGFGQGMIRAGLARKQGRV
jgi:hypothetical protein